MNLDIPIFFNQVMFNVAASALPILITLLLLRWIVKSVRKLTKSW